MRNVPYAQEQFELLTKYLHLIAYPKLSCPDEPVRTHQELCFWLHDEFVLFLGEKQSTWIDWFHCEWVKLCELIGETRVCAILTLRDPDVSKYLSRFA